MGSINGSSKIRSAVHYIYVFDHLQRMGELTRIDLILDRQMYFTIISTS